MTSTGRKGHVSVSRHWLADPRLSDTDLRLMLWLDSHTDEYLNRLNVSKTAEQLGWSRDRVKRSLDALTELKLISTEQIKVPGTGSRTWTHITLHESAWTENPVPHDEARRATSQGSPVPHDEAHPVPYGKAHTYSKHSGEESNTESSSTSAEVVCVDQWGRAFESWYADYPRKVGRPAALKAFKAKLKGMSTGQMMQLSSGTLAWVRHWADTGRESQFIPHPATFLNQERYNDEPPAPANARPKPNTPMGFLQAIAERDHQ